MMRPRKESITNSQCEYPIWILASKFKNKMNLLVVNLESATVSCYRSLQLSAPFSLFLIVHGATIIVHLRGLLEKDSKCQVRQTVFVSLQENHFKRSFYTQKLAISFAEVSSEGDRSEDPLGKGSKWQLKGGALKLTSNFNGETFSW